MYASWLVISLELIEMQTFLKCDLSPYLVHHIYDGMNCTLKSLPVLSPYCVTAVKLKILILLKVGLGS